MEENYVSENPPAPAGSEVTEFCGDELTRSNSDLPSFIAENYEVVLRGSANATPLDRGLVEENKGDSCSGKGRKNNFLMENCSAWTNEKHNLYLNHLEVSFVKQLNQSISLRAQCSEQNKSEIYVSQKQPSSVHNASEQVEDLKHLKVHFFIFILLHSLHVCMATCYAFQIRNTSGHLFSQFSILWHGYSQKINYERRQPLLRTSADSHDTIKSPWRYGSRQKRKQCPLLSADIQESQKLQNADKPLIRKQVSSQGLETCSQQNLTSDLYRGDLFEFLTEGTGQNFVDEGCQNNQPNISSQAKRLKRALVEREKS